MTALAGLPLYPDLASVLDVGTSIANHLHVKERGWTDEQILLSLSYSLEARWRRLR